MLKKDFDLFKQKYTENCKTESENAAILELYSFLLQKEVVDSDVWTDGGGNDEVIRILENYFSETDWKDLELDLDNWTTEQLEIFTSSILEGSGQKEDSEDNSTVMKRFYLLKKLLVIGIKRDRLRNDIFLALIDNIEFLNKCQSITLEEITTIANYFDYFERIKNENIEDNLTLQTLKRIIEKTSN